MKSCELLEAEERDDVHTQGACTLHDLSSWTQREAEIVTKVGGGGGAQRPLCPVQTAGAIE